MRTKPTANPVAVSIGALLLVCACQERVVETSTVSQRVGLNSTEPKSAASQSPPAQAEKPIPSASPPVQSPEPTQPKATPHAPSDPACVTLCGRSAELGCSAQSADCVITCDAMVTSVEACSNSMRVAIACFAAAPKAQLECDEAGLPAIRDGYCDKEQEIATECLAQRAESL